MKKIFILIPLILILFFLLIMEESSINKSSQIKRVCFKNNCFKVEVANTAETRRQGLMFKKDLAQDNAMLFVFDKPGIYKFWMKNTLIPLDIIWLDGDKKIVFIKSNAQPCVEEPCESFSPGKEAKYVLEINGGLAEKLGLEIGETAVFK